MQKIKRSIMSMILIVSITFTQALSAQAMPVVPYLFEGAIAIMAALAVTLGYQTSDSDDFKEMFRLVSPTERLEIAKALGKTAYVLTPALTDIVKSKMNIMTSNKINVPISVPRDYKTSFEANVDKVDLSLGRIGKNHYSLSGYKNIESICFKEGVVGGYLSSSELKIGQKVYRLLYSTDGKHISLQVYKNGIWQKLKISKYMVNGSVGVDYYTANAGSNFNGVRLAIDENNQFIFSVSCGQSYIENHPIFESVDGNWVSHTINDTPNVIDYVNQSRTVVRQPVDDTKLKNKVLDCTQTYSPNDLTYNESEIRPSTLTSVDPITKSPSSNTGSNTGTNTGGTTIDLTDVKANIQANTTAVNNATAQINGIAKTNYDFFGWLKAFLATMLTAIVSIPTSIVSAVDGVKTAVLSIPTAIVNALEGVKTAVLSIPTAIVSALEGVKTAVLSIPTAIVSAINGIKDLVTSIPTAIATALTGLFTGITTAIGNITTGIIEGLKALFIPNAVNYKASVLVLQGTITNQLGIFKQAFEVLFRIVKQDYKYIKPKFVIKLDPPFGNGSEYEIIDLKFYEDYRPTIMLLENAIVWFIFFRKVAMHNPFRGGGND